jgi:hypothetical protein
MLEIDFSSDEKVMLEAAEKIIATGLKTFLQVGEALALVRDQRLYRQSHDTFEDYCHSRWNITDRRARQLIDAAAVVTGLPTGTTVPVNEGQARELVGLDPQEAATVMQTAEESTGGKVTATAVREARRATFSPSGKPDARSTREMGESVPPVRARAARQSPLPKSYFRNTYDLLKRAESLARLHQDDRFARNRETVAAQHGPELARAANTLLDLLDDLGVDRHRYGFIGDSHD